MIRLILVSCTSLLFALSNLLVAQGTGEQCAAHLLHNQLLQTDPAYANEMQQNEQFIQTWIQNQQNGGQQQLSTTGVLTVPVVVHIVHSGQPVGTGANISVAQINSAITTLNDRFRKTTGTHGDAGGVDIEVEFCLAQRDPNCLATTGIVRVNGSSVTDYALEGINAGGTTGASETAIKALSAWPNTDYVNIWVVTEIENNNGGGGIQGYAYFPGASSAVDGVVIMHTAFGTLGTVNTFNNLCRTLTHEMGHYFNLYHTFEGDNSGTQCPASGNLCGSNTGDCCGDTEIHQRSSSNCPSGINSCTSAMFGSVVNNYMDYSSQTCANEFTSDQKARMRAALCGPRASLLSSLGCTPVTMVPPASATCTPQTTNLTNTFGMGTRNVTFNDLNVTSGHAVNDGGYVDNTCNQAANLFPSTPYSLSVFTGSTNNQDVHVYIDFNNDNDFLDAGEQVLTSTNDTLHTLTYTTPASPTTGTFIRMRVISDWVNNTITNSCYTPQYGQVEDYSILFASTASITLTTTSTPTSCSGGNDGSATASASNGTAPYTFSWNNGGTSATITGLTAGSYTVTATDATGSTQTSTVVVSQPGNAVTPSITTSTNVSCNGGFDGSVSASVTGGTPSYTFNWSNGGTNSSMSGIPAGTYTLTVSDASGCTGTTSVTITEPTPITATSTVSNVTTTGGSNGAINISPSGGTSPYSFVWSSTATTQNLSGITAGTYTVTITDANGCTGTHIATVTQPSGGGPLALSTISTNLSCNGANDGTATANPSGGTTPYTFIWSNAATTATITGLSIGNYTVTLTDAVGATQTSTVTILQPFALGSSFSTLTQVACFGGTTGAATINVTGGLPPYTYNWSNGGTADSIVGLTAGLYTVTVSDINGCTSTAIAGINQPGSALTLTNTVTNVTTAGGNNGAIDLTVAGGTPSYTYAWSNGATSEDLSTITAGIYTITVTDANGCTSTSSITVTQPGLNVSTTVVDVSCNGLADGSATAIPTGGTPPMTFIWSNGATTATTTGLAGGTYTVTVTDGSGLPGVSTATVNEPGPIAINVNASTVSCNGGNDASATASVSGGTTPYTFNWSNGMTAATTMNLIAGTHSLTVTDANGCISNTTFTVTQPSALSITGSINNPGGCSFATGTLVASGGTAPYAFIWSTGATTATLSGLSAGTYAATVTDANGCTAVQGGLVATSSGQLTATLSTTNITCNGAADGTASIAVSSGASPFTYQWSGGQNTASVTGLIAGTFTITVTDSTGCDDTLTATITEPSPMSITLTTIDPSCGTSTDGSMSVAVTGGVVPYTYAWSGGQSTATASNLSSGTYTVTITDAGGCTMIGSDTLNGPLPIPVVITPQGSTNLCGGSLTLSVNTGPTYIHQWTLNGVPIGGATNTTLSVGIAGLYGVITTDIAGGCTNTADITITSSPIVVTFTGLDPNGYCEGDSPATLTGSPAGGSFSGSGITGNQFNPDSAGVGTFMIVYNVTDSNGCSGSDTQTVSVISGASIGSLNGPIVVQPNQSYVYQVAANNGSNYQWIVTGGTVTAQANNVASINWGAGPTGTLTLIETTANGCTDTLTVTIYIGIVSVSELATEYGLNLYPNPVRTELYLELPGEVNENLSIEIWNSLGQVVFQQKISSGSNNFRQTLNVSDWAKGLYLVSIVGDRGIDLRKIVVQ